MYVRHYTHTMYRKKQADKDQRELFNIIFMDRLFFRKLCLFIIKNRQYCAFKSPTLPI